MTASPAETHIHNHWFGDDPAAVQDGFLKFLAGRAAVAARPVADGPAVRPYRSFVRGFNAVPSEYKLKVACGNSAARLISHG
jgi:hypothetical protein